MMISRWTMAIATCAMLSVMSLSTNSAWGAEGTRIAVVDVQRVFESLEERTEVEASMQAKAEEAKAVQTDKQNVLRDLQADLEVLAKGSAAYEEKLEELERGLHELNAWREYQGKKINRMRAVQIEGLYRKVLETIGRVATDNAYDMVMFKEPEASFVGAKPEQLLALIGQRKLLWSSDELDLTDQVIDRMNSERRNLPGN